MRVSVVTANWNGKRFLKEYLDSLMNQTYKDLEVILIDNGSTDGSVEFIKYNYLSVRVIKNENNKGFAEANNQGIRMAEGEYIVTLNNDTNVHPDCIKELVECADRTKAGSVMAKMLHYHDHNKIDATGITPFTDGGGNGRGLNELDGGKWDEEAEIFGCCAGAALYRKDALEDVKEGNDYFDSSFIAYFEDVDLSFRLQSRGWKSVYCPKAKVLHHGRGTSGGITEFVLYWGQINRLKVLTKNIPVRSLLRFLPWIVFRQLAEYSFYTILKRSFFPTRARVVFLKSLPETLKKREFIRARTTHWNYDKWLIHLPIRTLLKRVIGNKVRQWKKIWR